MFDVCIANLQHFSKDHVYIPDDHSNFYLEETAPEGAGRSFFSSNTPCIVFKAGRSGPLIWSLKNRKIAEGAILTCDGTGYHLHILEMKSRLTQSEWSKALDQFQGMLLSSIAASRLLGVTDFASVSCYIAFKTEAMSASQSAELIFMKTFVGMDNPYNGNDSWERGVIKMPFVGNAKVVKITRDANNDAHFGLIQV